MSLKFSEIKDAGDFMKERFIFTVESECELGKYLVAHSKIINDTSFSSKLQDLFWFPDKTVQPGDLVVLYTKKGESSAAVNEDNSKTYFYYWGLESPLSTSERSCLVLLDASWKVAEITVTQEQSE